ncbi:T9SS type A sorting domain-containing protein [Flavobacterium sp. 140616W15]|uniref:T9SS type A sorting domain-containing protein n=1 Tax=Flavobacterium sp. 140616W15 TaxID=2478552 RepID=UPI000F0C84EB|nr:T9SS type A sorting domain-containing protein [Flavobacterium sp. 140616W15]AYN05601.1 T9SS C-terminal target domain-containing protein [Flavobacterium sp. 140616W15]
MKKTLLYLFFLLTSFSFYAQISPIVHCDGNTLFDLTSREPEIIGDLKPAETTISYHLNSYDASRGAYAIPIPTSFESTGSSTSVYARINNKGNVTVKSFLLNVSRSPLILNATIKHSGCYKSLITLNASGGTFPYQYSKDGVTYQIENYFYNMIPGAYTVYTKDSNGCTNSIIIVVQDITIPPLEAITLNTMVRCNGDSNAEITSFVSGGTPPYSCYIEEKMDAFVSVYENSYTIRNIPAGMYRVVIKDAMGCAVMNPIEVQEPKALTATVVITDQTITVNATGGTGKYSYSINHMPYQSGNVFTNISPGIYDAYVIDENGCIVLITQNIVNPPSPLFEGKKAITLNLTAGQTLADINVSGTGIKWYSNATSPSGKTKKLNETFLPLSTVLVDNTTYYASQTINDIESKERLAVTVKLNTLSNPDFEFGSFKYHPNPVKNILSIENSSVIDEVTLFSVAGKVILDKKINSLHSDLDLSHVAIGIYFLKVKSEGREKTIKIVKE